MTNTTIDDSQNGFSRMVEKQLEKYFAMHDGNDIPPGLYRRVLSEVEQALFKVTMKHYKGNNLKASQVLGINRNTLRKKIADLGENNT
jgi:two-component system nitrogen regulation response regulator GlnG